MPNIKGQSPIVTQERGQGQNCAAAVASEIGSLGRERGEKGRVNMHALTGEEASEMEC